MYNPPERYVVTSTDQFDSWLTSLKSADHIGRLKSALRKLMRGNFGSVESLKNGLFEYKADFGPGFRIYFCQQDGDQIILLFGGDKSFQSKDIQIARKIKRVLEGDTDGS